MFDVIYVTHARKTRYLWLAVTGLTFFLCLFMGRIWVTVQFFQPGYHLRRLAGVNANSFKNQVIAGYPTKRRFDQGSIGESVIVVYETCYNHLLIPSREFFSRKLYDGRCYDYRTVFGYRIPLFIRPMEFGEPFGDKWVRRGIRYKQRSLVNDDVYCPRGNMPFIDERYRNSFLTVVNYRRRYLYVCSFRNMEGIFSCISRTLAGSGLSNCIIRNNFSGYRLFPRRFGEVVSFFGQPCNIHLLSTGSSSKRIGLTCDSDHFLKLSPIDNGDERIHKKRCDTEIDEISFSRFNFFRCISGGLWILCGGIVGWWGWYCAISTRLNWSLRKSFAVWLPCSVASVLLFWHGVFILAGEGL